jgi:hypothetical protein
MSVGFRVEIELRIADQYSAELVDLMYAAKAEGMGSL